MWNTYTVAIFFTVILVCVYFYFTDSSVVKNKKKKMHELKRIFTKLNISEW
jgi:hypothetical protein